MLVQVNHLSRSFGLPPEEIHAVKDISFGFDAGEIFGFIGPNGAGKSTTMRILATLDLPSSGDCLVGGMSTVDDAPEVRRLIGYMPDSYGAYPNMDVGEYLDFFARAYDLEPGKRRTTIDGIMEFCQLGGIRDKLVATLSKGMKQRLCLGRCLIHDPQVLILDEPSAGLDPRARIEFRELLKLLAGQGKGIFISSHILAELEELCTSVAIIEQGALIATGRVAELKARAAGVLASGPADAAADPGATGTVHQDELEIRLSAGFPELAKRLAEEPALSEVRHDAHGATARFRGTPAERTALLKRLIDHGAPICHFAVRARDLEDVFLSVTEGRVA